MNVDLAALICVINKDLCDTRRPYRMNLCDKRIPYRINPYLLALLSVAYKVMLSHRSPSDLKSRWCKGGVHVHVRSNTLHACACHEQLHSARAKVRTS